MSARAGDLRETKRLLLRALGTIAALLAILGSNARAAGTKDSKLPPDPREWTKRLLTNSATEDPVPRSAGAWPIVAYWLAGGSGGSPRPRPLELKPSSWDRRGLTRAIDTAALQYGLRLNPRIATAAGSDGDGLARRMMLLAGVRLAVDLGPGGNKPDAGWTLWTLTDEGAVALHRAAAGKDRSPETIAAFIRRSLGFDGIILDVDGDHMLARVAAGATKVGQMGLVLSDSAAALRIDDEREREGSALVRIVAAEGSLATLRLVSAPRLGVFSKGTKLVLDQSGQELTPD